MKYLVRCKYGGYGSGEAGVGYLDAHSGCHTDVRAAKTFGSEAEAWDFALASGNMGRDEQGEWVWVEPAGPFDAHAV